MVPKIKRGNSIPVKFTVIENGEQKEMSAAAGLTWRIEHAQYGCRRMPALRFEGGNNPYTVVAETTPESLLGIYYISLSYAEGGERRTVDAAAFELVEHAGACVCRNPEEAICVLADTCIGAAGESAYEIYRRRFPESALTEQEYAALPVEAATAALAAGAEAATAAQQAAEAVAAINPKFDMLAHSECTLAERVAAVEGLLLEVISGKVLVQELQVERLSVWGNNNLTLVGSGAPAKAPDRAGQFYIDTDSGAVYKSTGNAAVSDWKIV